MSSIAPAFVGVHVMSPRFSAWWLAFGLVGCSATALRFHGLPLGLGELGLLGWLTFEWGRRLSSGEFQLRKFKWRNYPLDVIALLVTLVTLAAAQAWAILAGHLVWYAQRDFAAIIFAGGLALTLSSMKDRESFSQEMLIAFFWIAAGFSTVLLLYGFIALSWGWQTWVYNETFGVRFLGLTTNPNQFALFSLTLPACLGLMWMRTTGTVRRLGVILGWFAMMAGLATLSNALELAWSIVAVFLLALSLLLRNAKGVVLRPALVVALSISIAFLGWWLVKHYMIVGTETLAEMVNNEQQTNPYEVNQVSIRLTLWINGLKAWMDSPWVGHGVQMVSGLTGPYQGQESHNTPIDWMTFSGILGLFPLLAWSVLLVRDAWNRRNLLGLGALLALAVYTQFGLFVRHPLFWVLVCAFAFLQGRQAQTSKTPS